jgi:hypothetical protein
MSSFAASERVNRRHACCCPRGSVRGFRGQSLIAAGAALIVASWPSPASACSYGLGFDPPAKFCSREGLVPSNAVVDEEELLELSEDSRALFEAATELNDRFAPCLVDGHAVLQHDASCGRLHRLRGGVAAGTPVRGRGNYACVPDRTTESTPDVTPPATPVLADIVIELKTDPADTGCFSCPDLDFMTIFVTNVSDDRATRKQMYVAIYVGATEDEARTRAKIDHLVVVSEASEVGVGPKRRIDPANGPAVAIRAIVGESVDRNRSLDDGIFRGGPHCITVETMDRAGNLSARSNAMCFDHTNESDPGVRSEEGGCACSTSRGPRLGSALLGLLTAAIVRRARRRSSPFTERHR